MNPAAKSVFLTFNGQFEGAAILHMYLDQIGLVTTGYGNLIDGGNTPHPFGPALSFAWQTPDGVAANAEAVVAEWHRVKALQAYARFGGASKYFADSAKLHTTIESITLVCDHMLASQEVVIRHFIPEWDLIGDAPQLAVASIAWAAGPGALHHFPKFCAAVNAGEWETAAQECALNHPPIYQRRNAATAALLRGCVSTLDIPNPLPTGDDNV